MKCCRWLHRFPQKTRIGRGARLGWRRSWPKLLSPQEGATVAGGGERATLSPGGTESADNHAHWRGPCYFADMAALDPNTILRTY